MLVCIATEREDDYVVKRYVCDETVTTTGDGLWDCEAGRVINVTGITVIENEFDGVTYTQLNVEHDSTWDIYTDTGFEAAISELVGFGVMFTEQGMQEDGCASMELA